MAGHQITSNVIHAVVARTVLLILALGILSLSALAQATSTEPQPSPSPDNSVSTQSDQSKQDTRDPIERSDECLGAATGPLPFVRDCIGSEWDNSQLHRTMRVCTSGRLFLSKMSFSLDFQCSTSSSLGNARQKKSPISH
jgi:hypothetical protein